METISQYLDTSVAPGTLSQYRRSWAHWLSFSTQRDLSSLPARPVDLALFLVQQHEAGIYLLSL